MSLIKGREQEQPWRGETEKDKSLLNAGIMSTSILFHSPRYINYFYMCDITMQKTQKK